MPIKGSQDMIDAIKAAGGTPKFSITPGVGHVHKQWPVRQEERPEVTEALPEPTRATSSGVKCVTWPVTLS